MALDAALEDALKRAVVEVGQEPMLAQRLIAWLKALSAGESSEEQDLSFYNNVMDAISGSAGSDAD